jgi:hypothetical protein
MRRRRIGRRTALPAGCPVAAPWRWVNLVGRWRRSCLWWPGRVPARRRLPGEMRCVAVCCGLFEAVAGEVAQPVAVDVQAGVFGRLAVESRGQCPVAAKDLVRGASEVVGGVTGGEPTGEIGKPLGKAGGAGPDNAVPEPVGVDGTVEDESVGAVRVEGGVGGAEVSTVGQPVERDVVLGERGPNPVQVAGGVRGGDVWQQVARVLSACLRRLPGPDDAVLDGAVGRGVSGGPILWRQTAGEWVLCRMPRASSPIRS